MTHLHCMGQGQGRENDGFLYYAMYCEHYTETGTGTRKHYFLLCPSRSLSRFQARSHAMSLSHKCMVYVYILAFFGVDAGDLAIACILISIAAKISISISISASRNSQLTVSLLLYAACSSAMTNCATCSSATACTTCDSGYYETSGSPDTCNRE